MQQKRMIRTVIATLLIVTIAFVYTMRLVKIQLIDGEMYFARGRASSVRTVNAPAVRGEILDRNGVPLVVNRMGCSIIFDAAYFPSRKQQETRNKVILSLIRIVEEEEESWKDYLPLQISNGTTPEFFDDRENDVARLKKFLNLNDYATPQNCLDALKEKYKLENYTPVEARNIASVCYGMELGDFSVSLPYTFAEDVSEQTVLRVKENSNTLSGVDVEITSYREYTDGTLAPHILGRVGAIDADEYAEKKGDGYLLNDSIGKEGIEFAMESYLKGTRGKKTITTDYEGNTSSEYTVKPVQGDTVVLTIDAGLQLATQNALEDTIHYIYETNQKDSSRYGPCQAGAVCVVKVDTGEVLAMATYPSYDISTYNETYAELENADNSPLWNRATMSTYAPGSTFKPGMALAALAEGTITKDTRITCRHDYTYFPSITFSCLGYHGSVNVVDALRVSCNIFFYETGRRLTIEKIDKQFTILGLGQPTNIEIGEKPGNLPTPEEGKTWNPGDTVQTAIGQFTNAYTPLQMAVYTAAVANGGTRYESHLVKEVKSYDSSEVKLSKEPVVLAEGNYSAEDIATVHEGMIQSANRGSIAGTFDNIPVTVASKTGTPQTGKGVANGAFITFAPAENPEIAIAILLEEAGSGAATARLAEAIYDYYYNGVSTDKPLEQNTLLP